MSIKKRFEEIHKEMENLAKKEVDKYNEGKISYCELSERLNTIKDAEFELIQKVVSELGDS